MARNRKPPIVDTGKSGLLQARVSAAEKQAFGDAAKLDGKKISEWVRDRLRRAARQELQDAGKPVAFLS